MSGIAKHSVTIRGHRTSFSLEEPFVERLRETARLRGIPFAALVAEVDAGRPRGSSLSSALRVFALGTQPPTRASPTVGES